MRTLVLFAAIASILPGRTLTQLEWTMASVQSPPTRMCGLTGSSAQDFIDQARRSTTLLPWPSDTRRFEIFQTAEPHYQLVVTTPTEPAHPAASCRETDLENGVWTLKRDMRCDGVRADCDALLVEFQALDAAMTRYLREDAP